jgi:hypothetical protein
LLHHFLVASTIASGIAVLADGGYTRGLDATTLQFGNDIVYALGLGGTPVAYPRVRAVDEDTYRDVFGETSPLDRAKLASVLSEIMRFAPKLVVIDIDVAPIATIEIDETTNEQKQKALNDVLDGASVNMVLPTATLSSNRRTQISRTQWMRDRCKNNERIHFGFADVRVSSGLILQYDPDLPSLALVARRLAPPGPSKAADGEQGGHPTWRPRVLCDEIEREGPDSLKAVHDVMGGGRPEPLDVSQAIASALEAKRCGVSPCGKLTGEVVFVGGAFDPRDRFWTAAGELDGVVIHAATYWSTSRTLGHRWLFPIEIAIGTLIAFPLSWCWRAQDRRRIEFERVVHDRRQRWSTIAKDWIAVRSLTLLAIVLSIATFLLLLVISGVVLGLGTWINPAPLVVGMSADSLLSSRERWEQTVHHGSFSPLRHLDILWQAPLWLYAMKIWLR